MKQLLTIIFLIALPRLCYSQNDCEYHISVPDELNRGRYKPEGMNYGNPYTMFNKRKPGWSLEGDLDIIREKILSQLNDGKAYGYAALYKTIFQNADDDRPGICRWNEQDCKYAKWVKSNAIVHLIGIKYNISSYSGYTPLPHESLRVSKSPALLSLHTSYNCTHPLMLLAG